MRFVQGEVASGTFFQNIEATFAGEEIRWNQRQCRKSTGLGGADRVFIDDDGEVSKQVRVGHVLDNGCFDGLALRKRAAERYMVERAKGKMHHNQTCPVTSFPLLTGQ